MQECWFLQPQSSFGLAVLQDASIEQLAGSKKKDQVSRASESHTYRRMIRSVMESNGRL